MALERTTMGASHTQEQIGKEPREKNWLRPRKHHYGFCITISILLRVALAVLFLSVVLKSFD